MAACTDAGGLRQRCAQWSRSFRVQTREEKKRSVERTDYRVSGGIYFRKESRPGKSSDRSAFAFRCGFASPPEDSMYANRADRFLAPDRAAGSFKPSRVRLVTRGPSSKREGRSDGLRDNLFRSNRRASNCRVYWSGEGSTSCLVDHRWTTGLWPLVVGGHETCVNYCEIESLWAFRVLQLSTIAII